METVEATDIINSKKNLSYTNRISFGGYHNITYINNSSNCKLFTLENLGGIFNYIDKPGLLKNFDLFLKRASGLMFFTNTNNIELVNKIKKHYKMIYCQEVPIGYNNGNQYHCGFLVDPNYPTYGKRIDDFLKKNTLKPVVENVNTDNLIEQFISKASNEEIDKLRSYKQPKRKKDLIEKIKLKV